jgi:Superinfection immunity protein
MADRVGVMATLIIVLVILGLYVTPTIVALDRKHRQTGPIAAVNLLLGWSLVGWVVALAWALTTDVKRADVHEAAANPPSPPAPPT